MVDTFVDHERCRFGFGSTICSNIARGRQECRPFGASQGIHVGYERGVRLFTRSFHALCDVWREGLSLHGCAGRHAFFEANLLVGDRAADSGEPAMWTAGREERAVVVH